MKSKFTVYMHIAPNGKKYIGITSKTVEERWNNGNGYRHNKHFFDAIQKHGKENFGHVVIADGLSKEEACELEKELIKQYDTTNREKGYNHSTGGDISAYGVKRSEEYVEKLRERHRGKRHSEATKEKISKSLMGNVPSNKGVPMKEESKRKMSVPVICEETGAFYFGLREAERQTGIDSRAIGLCLKGTRRTAGGCRWRRAV